jgi:uncharacterized NAD(P)/FAD-binding protein YdhS
MATLESVKPAECARADMAAYRDALDAITQHGANWADVVPDLRRAYAENFRTWWPEQWRQVQKVKAKK